MRPIKNLKKIIGFSALALLAHGSGRIAESYDHSAHRNIFQIQTIQAATQGYTWREGADVHANEYSIVLVKHNDMTMAGYLVDKNCKPVGMVRKGGYVGNNIVERAQLWGNKMFQEGKEQVKNLGEKTEELYQDTKKEIEKIVR